MLDPSKIYKELQPKLEELDKQRVKFYKKVEPYKYLFWIIFTVGGLYVLGALNFEKLVGGSNENIPFLVISYGVLTIALLLLWILTHRSNLSEFKKVFTAEIAPKVIHGMGRSFKYEYEGKIPSREISGSLLFAPYDSYQCQDLVTGELNGIPIKFAEIKLVNRQAASNEDKSNYRPFSGIFFRADLNVSFPTDIWLTSKLHAMTLAGHGNSKLKIDHPALRSYAPYAAEKEAGMKVLTPAVLDRIGELNSKMKDEGITKSILSYHFFEQHLELAISTRKKFMDPKLGQSIDTLAFIETQTSLLNALSTILEDLTLA